MEKDYRDMIHELSAYPSYFPDNNEDNDEYDWKDFLKLAKGNLRYALALRQRIEWEYPETLVVQDLAAGEIVEINGQYVMTDGREIEEIIGEI